MLVKSFGAFFGENKTSEFLRCFVRDDRGVIMVEWVALAAGLAVGAIAISYIVMSGLAAPASNIASQLSAPPAP